MKRLLTIALLTTAGLFAQAAHAQTAAPDYAGPARPGEPADTRKKPKKATDDDIARTQRRMTMNPEEAKRDQQLEILAARSGGTSNTTLGRGAGPARQYDKNSGGFGVRKFKDNHVGTANQKRGQSRPAPGIDPKGHPLNHKKAKHHRFLFF